MISFIPVLVAIAVSVPLGILGAIAIRTYDNMVERRRQKKEKT